MKRKLHWKKSSPHFLALKAKVSAAMRELVAAKAELERFNLTPHETWVLMYMGDLKEIYEPVDAKMSNRLYASEYYSVEGDGRKMPFYAYNGSMDRLKNRGLVKVDRTITDKAGVINALVLTDDGQSALINIRGQ